MIRILREKGKRRWRLTSPERGDGRKVPSRRRAPGQRLQSRLDPIFAAN